MYNDVIKSKLSKLGHKLAIKPKYLIVAFINGAVILMLEIIDARIMAPYFGASVYVWTAIIGVILGALSLGYWLGGMLADKEHKKLLIADVFLIASASLLISRLIQDSVLSFVINNIYGLRLQALIAAVLIFFPINVLLGMISPYIAEISLKDTSKSGRTVGSLFAAGTLGSIFGVFITGYFLLGMFGNSSLLVFLVIVLALNALIVREKPRHSILSLAVISYVGLIIALGGLANTYKSVGSVIYDGDSSYSRVIVEDRQVGDSAFRGLITGGSDFVQSYINTETTESVFPYVKKLQSISRSLDDTSSSLLIGGGAYTIARDFNGDHPSSKLDVVELDPKLIEVAKKYFSLEQSSNLRNINEDGRTFLNVNKQKYNFMMVDVFNAEVPPFQLCTVEAVTKMRNSLDPKGVLASNIYSYDKGDSSSFLWSQYKTYSRVFDYVAVVRADTTVEATDRQNYVLLASNDEAVFNSVLTATGSKPETVPDLSKYMVLTDDFAPVEQLMPTPSN